MIELEAVTPLDHVVDEIDRTKVTDGDLGLARIERDLGTQV